MDKKGFHYYICRMFHEMGKFFWLIGDFVSDLPIAVLSPKKLEDMVDIYYRDQKRVVHWSKNSDKGLSVIETEFIKRYDIKKGAFLVIASGGGREAFGLAEKGLHVTAIDISEGLIRFSRAKAERKNIKNLDFQHSSIQNFRPGQKFDYIFFSGRSYNYIPTRRRRVELLRKIRTWMNPEGRFLLNFAVGNKSQKGKREYFYSIYKFLAYVSFGNRELQKGDTVNTEGFRHNFIDCKEAETEAKEAGFVIEREGSDLFLRPGTC